MDLVVHLDDDERLALWTGDGTGAFRRAGSPARPGRCYGQALADLDGDGATDVVAPCIDAGGVAVWLGRRGAGFPETPRVYPTPGTDSQALALVDLDGDGVLDVVTGGWERPTVSVLLGRRAR